MKFAAPSMARFDDNLHTLHPYLREARKGCLQQQPYRDFGFTVGRCPAHRRYRRLLKKPVPGLFQLDSRKAWFSSPFIFNGLSTIENGDPSMDRGKATLSAASPVGACNSNPAGTRFRAQAQPARRRFFRRYMMTQVRIIMLPKKIDAKNISRTDTPRSIRTSLNFTKITWKNAVRTRQPIAVPTK